MVTKEDLKEKYATLTTSELLDIIQRKFDYTELAVITALEEIANRNISEETIKEYKDEKIKKTEAFVNQNIYNDLTIWQKNLFYFIWIPFLRGAIKMNFREDGNILKLKQANYYQFYGFVFLLVLVFITFYFKLGDLISVALWIFFFLPTLLFDELFNRKRMINIFKAIYGVDNNVEEDI